MDVYLNSLMVIFAIGGIVFGILSLVIGGDPYESPRNTEEDD
jgi:hypothetical protein